MGITANIDISTEQRKILLDLFSKHIPKTKVLAFGSRVKWTTRFNSDLDLVVFSSSEQSNQVSALKEALEESNLPFRVDLLVWDKIPESFKRNIEEGYVVLVGAEVIRPDWQYLTLADVCEKITDGAHNSPKTVTNGKPMASVKDLTRFGVDLTEARLISTNEFDSLVKQGCRPQVGDVLIAKDGNSALDTACTVDKPLEAVMLSSVAILRPNKEILDSDFLKYYFCSQETIDYLKSNFISGAGAAIPRVVLKDFRKAEIKIPAIEIQREISRILRSLDSKIELNNQTNQTLEQIAQALFKSWFIDFDPVKAKIAAKQAGANAEQIEQAALCAISGKTPEQLAQLNPQILQQLKTTAALFPDALVDSELGEIPEGWEVRGLDKIANYINGLALQKFRPKVETNYLPVLKIAQLKAGKVDSKEKASPDIKSAFIVDNGDVVFSWSGSLVVDVWCGGKAALNQHLFKVTSDKFPKWFFYYFTKHHLDEFQRIAEAKAVTMGHIKREHLSSALCAFSSDIIENCNLCISKLLDQQIALRIQNTNLIEIRDNLLPKLLSGELNLSNLDEPTEMV